MRHLKSYPFLIVLPLATLLAMGSPSEINTSEQAGDMKVAAKQLRAGETKLALEELRALEENRAKFIKAYCLMELEDYDSAIDYLMSIEEPKTYILWDFAKFALAEAYCKKKEYNKAINKYHELASSYSESIFSEESTLRIGKILVEEERYNEAYLLFKQFIDYYPESIYLPEARFNFGLICEKTGAWKEASKIYQDISLYHPFSEYTKDAHTRLQSLKKKYKLPSYKAAPEALYKRGMIFYNGRDYKSACVQFRDLVKLYPASPLVDDSLVMLGRSEYRRKLYSYSIIHFKEAMKYKGDKADAAQYYMAFAYGKSGNLNGAISSLRKVIKNYPKSPYVDEARYYIGYYYELNKKEEEALVAYRNLLKYSKQSSLAPEALWRMGRIYYGQKKWKNAYIAFKRAVEEYPPGSFTDKCAFWQGKSADKLGNKREAIRAYKFLTKNFDHTYYSYRAREKLNAWGIESKPHKIEGDDIIAEFEEFLEGKEIIETTSPYDLSQEEAKLEKKEERSEKKRDRKLFSLHLKKFKELMSLHLFEDAEAEATFILSIAPEEKLEETELLLSQARFASGKYRESMLFAEGKLNEAIINGKAKKLPPLHWKLAYPRAFYSQVLKYSREYNLDPYLVLAVIREESRFNPKVVSWAKAHGLMQIIPSTGRGIARLLGIKPYYTTRLFEPEINIRMGCYYLSNLLKRFQGNTYLALAAYNGGPRKVRGWLNIWWRAYGDHVDIDEFIEGMPYQETTRYVQKVMASYMVYKRIYEKEG